MTRTKEKPITALTTEFDSNDFNSTESTRYPYIQKLGDSLSPGLFLPAEQMDDCGWTGNVGFEDYTLRTRGGDQIPGVRIVNPKLLVIQRTPLYLASSETGRYVQLFDKGTYERDRNAYRPTRRWLIMLVNEKGEFGHQQLLQITLRGVFGASLGQQHGQFRSACERGYAVTHNQPNRGKTDRFHALAIFEPELAIELRGQGSDKSPALVCTGYRAPAKSNWTEVFLGYQAEVKAKVFQLFEESEAFAELKSMQNSEQDDSQVVSTEVSGQSQPVTGVSYRPPASIPPVPDLPPDDIDTQMPWDDSDPPF